MGTITQTIPAYTGGLSQQPDELKIPGQLNTAKNVWPDVTFGLQKRPGGKLVASMSDSGNITVPDGTRTDTVYGADSVENGRWFSYYRDESEQYIGQVSREGGVRMWNCTNGAPVPVVYDGGEGSATQTSLKLYLNHKEDDDIQTFTINDYTYLSNRATLKNDGSAHPKTTVAMKALTAGEYNTDVTVDADKNKNDVRPNEVFVNLKKISYSSQYGLNLFDSTNTVSVNTATRISVTRDTDSKSNCLTSGNNTGELPASGNLPINGGFCTDNADDDQDAYCPNVATRIFDIDAGDPGPPIDANGTAHDYIVTNNSDNQSNTGKNLYFRIATTGQSVAQGGSQAQPDYRCRYTTTHDLLYGGEGWETGDFFYVWMKNARYKVVIEDHSSAEVQCDMAGVTGSGLIRPIPTPFDNSQTITAESILADIRTRIIQYSNNLGSDRVTMIGSGLYITRGDAFNASTPVGTLMDVLTGSIDDVEGLPIECKHGYVLRVKNTDSSDEDDYFVKFVGDNGRDGTGTWEECPEPGRKINFDEYTMPCQLVRLQDNAGGNITGTAHAIYFKVSAVDWDKCQTGDTTTSPEPSFVGKKISKIQLWRNRLIILSDENVVMSQPGEFFNFWNKTAMTFSNTDPIDLSVGSRYPAILYDSVAMNAGLVMFTKNQQFLLTTDSDILNPTTAKINTLSNYNFNYKTNPISLGTTVGFLDNAGKYSRFFEIARISRDTDPDVVEQSKIVGKLFDNDLNHIAVSRENGVIFFCEKNTSTIYGFKFFNAPEKRLQQSWFTWEVSGNVQYLAILDDSLYAVIRQDDVKDVMHRFDLKLETDSRLVTDYNQTNVGTSDEDDVEYRIHLDGSHIVASSALTYNATTNKTTFTKPVGFNWSASQIAAYVVPTTSDVTFQGMTGNVTVNGGTLELEGNWKTYVNDAGATITPVNNLVVGYLYTMEVEFPTIHYTRQEGESYRSETRGSLVLHRAKLNLGSSGLYETTLKRTGKPDYVELYEPIMADAYNANQVQFTEESIRTIPIYDRNTNTTLTLKSTHASPATLNSMTWEGDYNTRYYNRV